MEGQERWGMLDADTGGEKSLDRSTLLGGWVDLSAVVFNKGEVQLDMPRF